jgi:hypothetical protein
MPNVRGIHLDEATELCRDFFPGMVTYPFKEENSKRKRREEEPTAGPSGISGPKRKKSKKEGKLRPKDDKHLRKYCSENMPETVKHLLLRHIQKFDVFKDDPELSLECVKIVANSLAKRTWNKYNSALKLWKIFSKSTDCKKFSGLAFLCWCKKNTSLRANTIKAYLGALRKLKFLLGFKSKKNGKLEKIILKGMENMESKARKKPVKTLPISLKIMAEIKKGLDMSVCSPCSKQSIWTCTVISFWSLARLGEILPIEAKKFDKTSTLLWRDVNLEKNKVTLSLNSTKTNSKQSKTIILFDIPEKLFCPVTQLKNLKETLEKRDLWEKSLPVFLRSSGKSLTKKSFLKAVNTSLELNHGNKWRIQGKSFRSGIPSFLGSLEDDQSAKILKTLGRWKGNSFLCYIRNPGPASRSIFDSVASKVLTDFMCRKRNDKADPDSGEQ